MTTRTPIVSEIGAHRPLDATDRLPGSAVQISTNAGNALSVGSDGGLYSAAGQTAVNAYVMDTGLELEQPQWVAAGSPSDWNVGPATLTIPDALLARRCLLFVHANVSPISSSQMTYYDSGNAVGVPSVALFQMLGSTAGRLTTKPDNNVPVPTWGIYLINPNGAVLPTGSKITRYRILEGVNYTSPYGIIRLYETMSLVPL